MADKLTVEEALGTALKELRSGRLKLARRLYETVLHHRPDNEDALQYLGVIAYEEGNTKLAIEFLKNAITSNQSNAQAHGNLGEIYRTVGLYEQAITHCRWALNLEPRYPEAWNTLGAALHRQGNRTAAETALSKALELKPNFPEALANLGNLRCDEGDLAPALDAYRRALELRPHLAEVHAALGGVLRRLGRRDEALECCRRAMGLSPRNASVWSNVGVTLAELGYLEEALHAHQRAIDCDQESAEAHVNMGIALRRTGRAQDALRAYERAIACQPGLVQAHRNRGILLEKMNRLQEARSALLDSLDLAPGNAPAQLIIARLDRRAGDPDKAREQLESLLSHELDTADRASVLVELAHVLDMLGKYAAAYSALERGQELLAESEDGGNRGQLVPKMIARNLHWFSKQRVDAWSWDSGWDSGPAPIFLVGFPRSGTTLVEQILAASPAVRTSGEAPIIDMMADHLAEALGRPASYPEAVGDFSDAEIGELRARYWNHVSAVIGEDLGNRHFIDKMPMNIIHLGLISRLFPQAKVLAALRDPRDVCLSCFFQQFEPNEATAHFYKMESTVALYREVMTLWLHYRQVLPLNVLEFKYENLVSDFRNTVGNLFSFLGLDWNEQVLDYHKAAQNRYISTPSYEGVIQPIYSDSVGRWRRYRDQLAPVLPILSPFVEQFAYSGCGQYR